MTAGVARLYRGPQPLVSGVVDDELTMYVVIKAIRKIAEQVRLKADTTWVGVRQSSVGAAGGAF
jgi:putative aminopeptidase FrvX